jgi:hypothetical protein
MRSEKVGSVDDVTNEEDRKLAALALTTATDEGKVFSKVARNVGFFVSHKFVDSSEINGDPPPTCMFLHIY